MRGVPDSVADRVWVAIPQPTEWQLIRHQIDAAVHQTNSFVRLLNRSPVRA